MSRALFSSLQPSISYGIGWLHFSVRRHSFHPQAGEIWMPCHLLLEMRKKSSNSKLWQTGMQSFPHLELELWELQRVKTNVIIYTECLQEILIHSVRTTVIYNSSLCSSCTLGSAKDFQYCTKSWIYILFWHKCSAYSLPKQRRQDRWKQSG